MGGNALKEVETSRINTEEFHKTALSVCRYIRKLDSNARVSIPLSYWNKETHGDIDILVSSDYQGFIHDFLNSLPDCQEVYRNNQYTSFDFKVVGDKKRRVQVDIIMTPFSIHDFHKRYLNFNDLGNMIGRIAKSFGFKFGHNGLWYEVYYKGNKVKDVLVTDNFFDAISFLGFNVLGYLQAESKLEFFDLEDIFEYIIANEYFSYDKFDLSNVSNKHRKRDEKRSTYTKFLEWCRDRELDQVPPWKTPTKSEMLSVALKRFPGLFWKIKEVEDFEVKKEKVREVFNGRIVNELTGLEGKVLGKFIAHFKGGRTTKQFNDDLVDLSKEEVEFLILKSYQNYRGEV